MAEQGVGEDLAPKAMWLASENDNGMSSLSYLVFRQ